MADWAAMLDKTYEPAGIEARQYRRWEAADAFACGRRPDGDPYTIVIPPPNVTGSLHMGHALNNTLQDVLIRYARMRGRDALWQPGTDHAGIATQMVVERRLAALGIEPDRGGAPPADGNVSRIGRDDFVAKVWEWKAESGGTIISQLKRLGASCDWARERFTMDDGLSRAVLRVFVRLYRDGLIYKDQRLVNWDPRLHTAISDLEVVQKEVDGHLWHFRYPLEDEQGEYITVATTRPETMLGDTAVAVHPDDARYRHLIGRWAVLPIAGRRIRIVADTYADPEQGSGAVKITPAHDFNDFEVGRRHDLGMINVFDADARLNHNAPQAYRGLDRFAARDKVVAEMAALGLLAKVDSHRHTVPFGDRSDVVIEPWLTEQWYVDAATLAKPAIEAVEAGRTKFVPDNWAKTYFEWMRNIQPWCISRQLWWGHQIPAWYGPDGAVFVAESEAEAYAAARAHYEGGDDLRAFEMVREGHGLTRDPDVLDTWFSSALWPFSTLGWPDETPELARHYPTDVLVTGFDIIFFWVARMMMMGLHFMGEAPFHTVYIHALVRDAAGAKMSKSKGNVIDPLELVDAYGADALRFTLTAMAAMGRDIRLSADRVAGYRNFGTKLWNAARFCEMNGCAPAAGFRPGHVQETLNRWIVGEVETAAATVAREIEAYRFDQAAGAAYRFAWHTFCDWYLEFAKPVLQGPDDETNGPAKEETRATAAWALAHILEILHPFMPFVTEELWQRFAPPESAGTLLIDAAWPEFDATLVDANAAAEMDWVVRLITEVRTVRAEINVPPSARIPAILRGAGDTTKSRLATHAGQIRFLARLDRIELDGAIPRGAVQTVVDEATLALPLAGIVDLDAERARLAKEIARLAGEIDRFDAKLANANFVARAPEEVVEEQRERRAEAAAARARLEGALQRLSAA
jgi:valyl-tRNA synthetase